MKKQLILATALIATTGRLAFGEGWFFFVADKNSVWDGFTTTGVSVPGGHTIASFIWGPAGSVGLLGAMGNPTNNIAGASPASWQSILTDPSFHLATNATSEALVSVDVIQFGLSIGAIRYNTSASFTVAGTTAGATYTIYCIAWNNAFADPYAAAAAGQAVGWSNPFQYASGVSAASTPFTFSMSGMLPFGVSKIPEPTTFALAGLGVVALLAFRGRR